ncbi:MAG: hypothetical protein HDS91_05915 [Bacteroidales bacterium]|nr:hypothetical protein [Bacteroidales bacterium]
MNTITNSIDLRRYFRTAKKLWWLYLLAFIVFMGGATFYAYYRMPSFETQATMIIEDSGDNSPAGGLSSLLGRSFSIGGFGSSSVSNEIFVLNSHDLLINASRRNRLNRNYIAHDGIIRSVLYPDSPIELVADDVYFDTLQSSYQINVKIKPNGAADIEFVRGRFFSKKLYSTTVKSLPYVCDNPAYPVIIAPTTYYNRGEKYDITINVNSNEVIANKILKEVVTLTPDKIADVIQLTYEGPNKEYNKLLLNSLLNEYNNLRVERRKENARREVEFLDNRLAEQLAMLTESEKEIEQYKSDHNLSDIAEEMKLLVGQSVESEKELIQLRSSRDYYREVLAAIRSPKANDQLIPVAEDLSSPMIENYNTLMLQRKQLALSATPDNASLKIMDSNLSDLRSSIEKNAEGTIAQSTILINSILENNKATEGRLKNMPAIERRFFELTRDTQLQNELYLFLTEKRENAMLKYQSNSTLGFIVEEAFCAIKPSKKKTYLAFAACFVLALLCPSLLVIFITARNRKVSSPIDLNFNGLEQQSMTLTGTSTEDLRPLRRVLTDMPDKKRLYCINATNDAEILRNLAISFGNINTRAEVISSYNSNDALMTALSKVDDASYIMLINVPQPEHVADFTSCINKEDGLLIVITAKNSLSIDFFKTLISNGVKSSNIITAIV